MTSQTQILFNRAVTHVRKQEVPGYSSHMEMCRLLDPDGNRCAVGGLIDPIRITPQLETNFCPSNKDAGDLRQAIAASNPDLELSVDEPLAEHWRMLEQLQSAHDLAAETDFEIFMDLFERYILSVQSAFLLDPVPFDTSP